MYSDLSPWSVGISVGFDECLTLAKKHGFRGIDLPVGDPELIAEPEHFRRKVKAAGLQWGGFNLPLDFRGAEGSYNNGLDILKVEIAPAARRAGCTRCITYIMPGHNALDYQQNFELHARRLEPVAKSLADEGIRLGIEFVAPATLRDSFKHPFICDVDGILKLAEAVGHSTGVLLDSFHWYCAGGRPEDITVKLKDRVVYVHINDARAGRGPLEQIDNQRALPGQTGVIDLKGFLGCLRQIGYDGPVAAEPFLPELAELPADQAAARVAAAMKKIGL